MNNATHTQQTARRATALCLTLLFTVSVWSQISGLFPNLSADNQSFELTYALAETITPENYRLSGNESDHSARSSIHQVTVSRYLVDFHRNEIPVEGTNNQVLIRKNRLVQQYGIETGLDIFNGRIRQGIALP